MAGYQSLQVSPDGEDYITDYQEPTVDAVWDRIADQGSRWYFYPLPFVITAGGSGIPRKRIIAAPDGFEHLRGLTVRTAMRAIAEDTDYVGAMLGA